MDRYFTVATSAGLVFSPNTIVNEGDAEHVGFLAGIGPEEHALVLDLAQSARAVARCTGSREANEVRNVFGQTLHVTWKRVGV